MHISKLALSAALMAGVSAFPATEAAASNVRGFRVPEGTVDGFYRAYFNESGHEVHEFIRGPASTAELASLGERSDPSLGGLEARVITEYACGCGLSMNHGDCDAATADLRAQIQRCYDGRCSIYIEGRQSFYSIRGSVVAFGCNQSPWAVAVSQPEWLPAHWSRITDHCGWYVPGTIAWDSGEAADYGYMNWREGTNFCLDAFKSKLNHC